MPHPSGRCRAWNDPANALLARALVARATPSSGIAWGSALVAAALLSLAACGRNGSTCPPKYAGDSHAVGNGGQSSTPQTCEVRR